MLKDIPLNTPCCTENSTMPKNRTHVKMLFESLPIRPLLKLSVYVDIYMDVHPKILKLNPYFDQQS